MLFAWFVGLMIAGSGRTADCQDTSPFRLLSNGSPVKVTEDGQRLVRLPGAVVVGEVVDVISPVLRPSVTGHTVDESDHFDVYSIVEIRSNEVLAGESPKNLRVFWQPHVRRVNGRVVGTAVLGHGESPQQLLVPGMLVLMYVTPSLQERLEIPRDREPGLWDRLGPIWVLEESDSGGTKAYSDYSLDESVASAILRGTSSMSADEVWRSLFSVRGTSIDLEDATAELSRLYEENLGLWREYEQSSGVH